MKRFVALFLILLMVLSPVTVMAAGGEDSIRHDITGDVSEFVVGEESSSGQMNGEKSEAAMGTDIYLFVDPDNASYVTFRVTDEQNKPLKDAQIYIEHNGKSELFGTTDEKGELKTYLFRDTEYGYAVKLSGYETVEGKFTAARETRLVRVVMRKYYDLNIFVLDDGRGVQGAEVLLDGYLTHTDKDGRTGYRRTNGVYALEVITGDGRRIARQAVVNGNTDIIIDISRDDSIVPGGRCSDRFLVYDKDYNPEDYVLTRYLFTEEDLPDGGEPEAYLAANPNTVHIAAQPDRRRNSDGTDTDKTNPDGSPLYSRRSLMPTGFVIRGWEEQEFKDIVFMNEEMGLRFDMAALHSGDMMKVYALLHAVTGGTDRRDVVTEEVRLTWRGMEKAGIWKVQAWDFDVRDLDLSAVRDFVFAADAEEGDSDILPDALFTDSLFEFRLTPIPAREMKKLITDGLRSRDSLPRDELMLASWGYFQEELRRAAAAGRISESEKDELYSWFVDGRLTKDEIKELQQQLYYGKLSDEALQLLLTSAEDEKFYRVSCWLHYGQTAVNISELMDGMELIRSAERRFEAEYQHQLELTEDREIDEEELSRRSEAALAERLHFLLVDNRSGVYVQRGYKPGDATFTAPVTLRRSLPYADGEWYDILSEKSFVELTVDVYRESYSYRNRSLPCYRADIAEGSSSLSLRRAFLTESSLAGLVGLTEEP